MKYVGKKVKISVQNKYYYTGVVLDDDDKFITIKDKFDDEVMINKNDISMLKVVIDG